jgi:hypothetical protein
MTHRTMTSPLTTAPDDVMTEVGSVALEPFRDFEFDLQTNRLRVAGYSVAEVDGMLRLYREHLQALSRFATDQEEAMREAHS